MDQTKKLSPADTIELSSFALRAVVAIVTRLAERLGFWSGPRKSSGSTIEEMGVLDSLYWIHKSKHPIARAESPEVAAFARQGRLSDVKDVTRHSAATIGFCGDVLRFDGVEKSRDHLYGAVTDVLFDADVSFANFESPVTTQDLVDEVIGDQGPPIECCSKAQFDILTGHEDKSFSVLNLSNNHAADMGLEGVLSTQSALQDAGMLGVGVNDRPEARGQGWTLDANGLKIGIAADTFGLNGKSLPEEEEYRINCSKLLSKHCETDLSLLKAQIDDCKAKQCDFVVASVHWGHEFEFFPRDRQVKAARQLVEAGADCVICHHPHVIQPVEFYRPERDPSRTAVIAYSLGSLVWGFMAPHIALSMAVKIEIAKGIVDGAEQTYVSDCQAIPLVRVQRTIDGESVTIVERLTEDFKGEGYSAESSYIETIKRHADLVMGEDWRAST